MKQLTQRLRDGEISVIDVPPPLLEHGMVLVRNHYSLISAGTEGSTVATARKSLLGKAQERPQQVRQLLEVAGAARSGAGLPCRAEEAGSVLAAWLQQRG